MLFTVPHVAGVVKKKTNRVIVAYEDAISWGYGSEIASRIADDCFCVAR